MHARNTEINERATKKRCHGIDDVDEGNRSNDQNSVKVAKNQQQQKHSFRRSLMHYYYFIGRDIQLHDIESHEITDAVRSKVSSADWYSSMHPLMHSFIQPHSIHQYRIQSNPKDYEETSERRSADQMTRVKIS